MKSNLKPWQLVYVRAASQDMAVEYIGELVSMPTPADTIMVRKIPGYPGTLEEVAVERCELVEPGLWYVHYAAVDGNRKYFPADMLRSDQCIPVSFTVEWDETRGAHCVKTENDASTLLIVARVTKRKWPMWTEGRWASFNWGLAEMSSECFVQHAITEAA